MATGAAAAPALDSAGARDGGVVVPSSAKAGSVGKNGRSVVAGTCGEGENVGKARSVVTGFCGEGDNAKKGCSVATVSCREESAIAGVEGGGVPVLSSSGLDMGGIGESGVSNGDPGNGAVGELGGEPGGDPDGVEREESELMAADGSAKGSTVEVSGVAGEVCCMSSISCRRFVHSCTASSARLSRRFDVMDSTGRPANILFIARVLRLVYSEGMASYSVRRSAMFCARSAKGDGSLLSSIAVVRSAMVLSARV